MIKKCLVLQTDRINAHGIARAVAECFRRRGWRVIEQEGHQASIDDTDADLICGYGWHPWMQEAYRKQPDRVVHVDLAFWTRNKYYKIAMGGETGRWSSLVDFDYPSNRFDMHQVTVKESRLPGRRVLVAGMSGKAAKDWGYEPEQWERSAIERLRKAGAELIVYRPKPTFPASTPLPGAEYDKQGLSIEVRIHHVDAVVSHHSNVAIDALVAGLPIYVDTGISKSLSVPSIEDVVGAKAPDYEIRYRFLKQVAWHQWTLEELTSGVWMKPPAPLSYNGLFQC
jgi:hypothetical protein